MKKIFQLIIWLLGISLWHSQISFNTVVTEQNKVVTAPTSIRFLSGFRVTAGNVGTFHAYLNPNQGGGTVTPIDPNPSTGMSSGENYVFSTQCLDANCTKKTETIQYFDGLGRPKQVINVKASPAGKDIVTPIVYDPFGRQTRDYLPIPQQSTSNGAIYTQNYSLVDFPVGDPTGMFSGEKAFSEKVLENSPLDRILEQRQLGNAWSNKPVKFDYDVNAAGEVKKYVTSTSWSNGTSVSAISQSGTYNAGVLYKNTVTDEDGNKTIEFKNGQGQTILVKKELNASQTADTYYVYNEYEQLAFVIPPLASATDEATINNLCYQYRYDGQKRLVEKKIPGKDWEYMVYDKADRLVLTQDANLRAQGKWFFTKFDGFSRPIYTGILDSPAGRMQQSTAVEAAGLNIESRSTSSWNNSGMDIFYSNTSAYPTTNFKVLSINYYDTYPSGSPAFSNTFAQNVLTDGQTAKSTKSLPVASLLKNIEDDNWTRNYTWYDHQGRTIGTYSVNHLNGYTKTETDLDFAGLTKKSVTSHKRLNSDVEKIITETFEYDHQNRIKKQWHQINGQPQELLAENTYNEKSELTNKKVGNNLQSIDYLYNIRGWLTFINDPYALSGKLFGYAVKYQNPEFSHIVPAKYNGNISEVDWKTANDGIQRRYNYSYDSLSRLSAGIYTEPGSSIIENNYYNELMTYDLNGNIKTLARYSRPAFGTTAEQIDNLTYNYKNGGLSNQLERITLPGGIANNPSGYNALQNAISYDANGNMKDQLDKGISNISYNFLNLPDNITASIGNTSYIYSASGQKLKKVFGSKTVDYLNGFQYENNALQFIPTSEGYFDVTKNQYIYNYTDHLGNEYKRVLRFSSNFWNGSGISYRKELVNEFDVRVMNRLNDFKSMYIDGSPRGLGHNISSENRYNDGYQQGLSQAESIIGSLTRDKGNITESIKIITHSMGGVYGKGFVAGLKKYIRSSKDPQIRKVLISLVADFDPFQAGSKRGKADPNIQTQQFINEGWTDIFNAGWLANEREKGADEIKVNEKQSSHFISKFTGNINDLQEGTYVWDDKKQEWNCTTCKK